MKKFLIFLITSLILGYSYLLFLDYQVKEEKYMQFELISNYIEFDYYKYLTISESTYVLLDKYDVEIQIINEKSENFSFSLITNYFSYLNNQVMNLQMDYQLII